MKYEVTITRIGSVFFEAEDKETAMEIANYQSTEDVSWSDTWEVTDCTEYDDPNIDYVTE